MNRCKILILFEIILLSFLKTNSGLLDFYNLIKRVFFYEGEKCQIKKEIKKILTHNVTD